MILPVTLLGTGAYEGRCQPPPARPLPVPLTALLAPDGLPAFPLALAEALLVLLWALDLLNGVLVSAWALRRACSCSRALVSMAGPSFAGFRSFQL